MPLYPGSGRPEERGHGQVLNVLAVGVWGRANAEVYEGGFSGAGGMQT